MTAPAEVKATDSAQSTVDWLRFNALEEMADLNASYWRSVAEAASRNELLVVEVHCRQIAAVTREAFSVVKAIGTPPDGDGKPSRVDKGGRAA